MSCRWRLELTDAGRFPELPGDDKAICRIANEDSLLLVLPAGSTFGLEARPVLVVRNDLGEETQLDPGQQVGDWSVEWKPPRAGPYSLRLAAGEVQAPSSTVVVEPQLSINGVPLSEKAVSMQTVLGRCLGPIEDWGEMLQPTVGLGYNMLHFTPLQPPGESGSCFSLADFHSVDPALFKSEVKDPAQQLEVLAGTIKGLEKKGLLSATDIVLNHCAGNAPWLAERPGCAYTVSNSPHLQAAWELDERLQNFRHQSHIHDEGALGQVLDRVRREVLEPLRLHEFFQVDRAKSQQAMTSSTVRYEPSSQDPYEWVKACALPSIGASRAGAFVSSDVAKHVRSDQLNGLLDRLAGELWGIVQGLHNQIIESLAGLLRYERLQLRKPPEEPLFPRYFRKLGGEVVAHNGWVMDWPATEDFAKSNWRFVYLRRHLCVWDDCAKLRYGECPEDNPFLWETMTSYAVKMAKMFHGIRLDNAHSTPLHFSKYVLARVRQASPNCWIFAELFTGDQRVDLEYAKELGLSALIREGLQAGNPRELTWQLTCWGGHTVGSLAPNDAMDRADGVTGGHAQLARKASFTTLLTSSVPLRPRRCPALVYDMTHDNETPAQKRTPRDALPLCALVAASVSAVGTTRGFDDLMPRNLSVLTEHRRYLCPQVDASTPAATSASKTTEEASGAPAVTWSGSARTVVARGEWDGWAEDLVLRQTGACEWSAELPKATPGMAYKFIIDGNWQADARQATKKDPYGNLNNVWGESAPPQEVPASEVPVNTLPGIYAIRRVLNKLHSELWNFTELGVQHLTDSLVVLRRHNPADRKSVYFLVHFAFHPSGDDIPAGLPVIDLDGPIARVCAAATLYVNPDHTNGFRQDPSRVNGLGCFLKVHELRDIADSWLDGGAAKLRLKHFPPGSICVLATSGRAPELPPVPSLESLSLAELSFLLFSCESEERDRSGGSRGAYEVGGQAMTYCGLAGPAWELDRARRALRPLDQPITQNVCAGTWLLDYQVARLDGWGLGEVQGWLRACRDALAATAPELRAFYTDEVICSLFAAGCRRLLETSGMAAPALLGEQQLLRSLLVATAQFFSAVPSAPLNWEAASGGRWREWPSLCAGLPHFSTQFMRNWGRDTFISLRGCLLLPRRFKEAHATLLAFASVCRHGLIPNLLDACNRPRYNARDATWFFLEALQTYCQMAPEGAAILDEPVKLKFALTDWAPDNLKNFQVNTVRDVVHLILLSHYHGIEFVEWGAGPGIDGDMSEAGFRVAIRRDPDSGFIYGGSEWNCGTWMDKMGSSVKAGNKGRPATSRHGANVEIIGLLKSALRWSLTLGLSSEAQFKEWDSQLQDNFHRAFWNGAYYRDTLRDGARDQLRPNFPIAMCAAPELFPREEAAAALKLVQERLVGPLGMRTLCARDPDYRGDYDNANDSGDFTVAHGFNYHQGPEWVWPLGYFLRATLHFGVSTPDQVLHGLLNHRRTLTEKWLSLPELTNSNGKECHHSCPAQAWSIATLVEVLHDVMAAREAACT